MAIAAGVHLHASSHTRFERLKLAVIFSIVSKASSALAQMLALTLAVRLLGQSGYVTYETIWALSIVPNLVIVGYGPTLVSRVARLDAQGDQTGIRKTLWSALVPTIVAVVTIGISASFYVSADGLAAPFAALSPVQGATGTILILLIWLHLTGAILNVVEAAQAGFQEYHLISVRSFVGNLVSIVALSMVFPRAPTLWTLVLAAHGPTLLARVANAVILFGRRPFLLPAHQSLDVRLSMNLLRDGVIYTSVAGIAAYLCHYLPILLLARYSTASATTTVAAMFKILLQLFSIVSMVAVPCVPALSNSLAAGDLAWTNRVIKRMGTFLSLYGITCVAGFSIAGPWIVPVWFQGRVNPGWDLLVVSGVYSALLGLEYFFFLVLCSLGRLKYAASLYLVRAALMAISSWTAARFNAEIGIFWGGVVSVAAISLIPYFLMIRAMTRTAQPARIVMRDRSRVDALAA
jgi:O-antigen/teichoic acid export membrane protein